MKINDLFYLLGLMLITTGVGFKYSWQDSLIVAGALMITSSLLAATIRSRKVNK